MPACIITHALSNSKPMHLESGSVKGFPLSYNQRSIWLLHALEPNNVANNITQAIHLQNEIDLETFKRSLQKTTDRHPALRTTFTVEAGQPIQIVHAHQLVFFHHEDASEWDEDMLNKRLNGEVYHLFDLENGPLFRAFLFSRAANDHVFLLSMHHIISDMWSIAIFLKDFFTGYQNEVVDKSKPLPNLKTNYSDYVKAQQALVTGPKGEQLQRYWKKQLSGEPPVLNLPTDRPRQSVKTYRGGTHLLSLGQSLTESLKEVATTHKVTLFSVILAAFQVFLSRYSGQDDILVGTPKAGRSLKTARLVGYFINPVPLRANVRGDLSFATFLRRVHQDVLDAFAHDEYPFQTLLEDFQLSRELKTHPLFQVTFAWQKSLSLGDRSTVTSGAVGHQETQTQFKGFVGTPMSLTERVSPYDLSLLVGDIGDELIVTFIYKRDLFEARTIAGMASNFERLLQGIIADPNQAIARLPLLTDEARQRILVDWNDTAVASSLTSCLHHLFEAQAAKTPQAIAVRFDGAQLTYKALNRKANQLAHYLRQVHGVRPGVLVAIQLERSLEMIIGILGVLKAGGAYVPLDPTYPSARLAGILEDTKAPLLLSRNHVSDTMLPFKGTIIDMDTIQDCLANQQASNPDGIISSDDLAYVVYTSGSTGKPKGILAHHRGVVQHLSFLSDNYNIYENDVVLQLPTISFDASVRDIFTPLISGAQVVIMNSNDVAHPPAIIAKMQEHSVTCILSIVPSLLNRLLEAAETNWTNKTLRLLLTSGERLPMSYCRQAKEIFGADLEVVNQYGPTECTMTSTFHRVKELNTERPYALIGRPIANTQIYVLDKHLNPVPIGAHGEIYIGGVGVSYGYLNQPELTAQKFIADPFSDKPGAQLYKTGDLGRYFPDGTLEFIGRIDHQIKLRGYRIELGEIEVALIQHPAIQQAVVVAPEAAPDERRLVAFILANDRDVADAEPPVVMADGLRNYLKKLLPRYMIPASFVFVDQIPLTPNGKIDREALLTNDPDFESVTVDKFSPPQTTLEVTVATIWADVLSLPNIGIYDNFFELGGHSLLATQIASRIHETLQIDLPIRAIFEKPTIVELAKYITALQINNPLLSQSPIICVERGDNLPLSFSQERMWFLYQYDQGSTAYSIPGAVWLKGPLNKDALEWGINQVLIRHESLRTRFTAVNGRPTAVIEPTYTFPLPFTDCRNLSQPEREPHVLSLMEKAARIPFQLDHLPLFQMTLFQLDDEEHILFVNIHHIISDQWSAGVLSRDLVAYYRVHQSNQPANLPEMSIQAVDHAAWQRRLTASGTFNAQVAYWKKHLEGMTTLDLLADRPRPTIQTTNGAILNGSQPFWLINSLKQLSREENVSPFMILLAGFKLLLSRYTGVDDIAVGSPIANRHHMQSEMLISSLVNTLVLRTDLSGNPTFRQLLRRVKKMALDAYAHQDVPFERLVQELKPTRDTSRSPLFQIFFNVQNAPFSLPDLPHVESKIINIDRGAAQFDLSLTIDTAVTQQATLEYNSDLFDTDRMERLMGHYWTLLEAVVTEPDSHIADLPLLTKTENKQLATWNDTYAPYDRHACLHHLFEAQVARSPQQTAVTFQDTAITYQQLNTRANQLARHLQNLGVAPGSMVGIKLERSLEMIIALFAVHKAGAAYIPLDPAFPQERLDFMMADSQASVLLTQSSLLPTQLDKTGLQYVYVDQDVTIISQYHGHNLPHTSSATDLAYMIYTSGSTGKPKGVQIEHRSVVNFLFAMSQEPGMKANDIMLAVTTLSFDIAALEIFLPLLVGAQLVLADRQTAVNGPRLLAKLIETEATIMQATPTTWRMLLESGWHGSPQLKILCGGEALPIDLAQRLLPRCASLWNMYGPTETTIWSSVLCISPDMTRIPIGPPMANTQFYVLDEALQPVPVGVSGELYIAGDGLARGYWNRPEETAARFIEQTQDDGTSIRLYKTGDMVRYLFDGTLEFLGRYDHQVKIRGFRVELGDIETALTQHTSVREAVVIAKDFGEGDKRFVAYIIANDPEVPPTAQQLRKHLQPMLPDYMIPGSYVPLVAFPQTPNKKVDRKALPTPRLEVNSQPDIKITCHDDIERKLAEIWMDLFQVPSVKLTDNFFQLGGHSLLALRLFTRIEEVFGIHLPLMSLFQEPTIQHLAKIIRVDLDAQSWHSLVAIQVPENGVKRPFYCVHGLTGDTYWFVDLARHMGEDIPFYGLQSVGLNGQQEPLQTIEDMAAYYVSEMRAVQPEGPYFFGGYSYGAHVAYEMACQLQKQGQEVGLLAILDTFAILEQGEISRLQQILRGSAMNLDRLVAFLKSDSKRIYGRFHQLTETWKRRIKQQLSSTTFASSHNVAVDLIENAEQLPTHVQEIIVLNFAALNAYHPRGYEGDITLLQSIARPFSRHFDALMGWGYLTTGDVKAMTVPGSHTLMFREPFITEFATKLRATIMDAE